MEMRAKSSKQFWQGVRKGGGLMHYGQGEAKIFLVMKLRSAKGMTVAKKCRIHLTGPRASAKSYVRKALKALLE
jgi:hypothetical protein